MIWKGERVRISITGTHSCKLRARVTPTVSPAFEVTIGGNKWKDLDWKLREIIGDRARLYLNLLTAEVAGLK